MEDKLTKDFMMQISKIKDITIFIGVARLLGVKLDNEDKTSRNFEEVLEDMILKFESKNRSKRKELVSILGKANKEVKRTGTFLGEKNNGNSTKNSRTGE